MFWEGVSWSHVERVRNCHCHTVGGSVGIWTQVSLILKLEQWITLLCSLQTLDLETAPGSHFEFSLTHPHTAPSNNKIHNLSELRWSQWPRPLVLCRSLWVGLVLTMQLVGQLGLQCRCIWQGHLCLSFYANYPTKAGRSSLAGQPRDLSEQRAFSWWESGWYLAPLTFSLLSCAAALLLLILNSSPG